MSKRGRRSMSFAEQIMYHGIAAAREKLTKDNSSLDEQILSLRNDIVALEAQKIKNAEDLAAALGNITTEPVFKTEVTPVSEVLNQPTEVFEAVLVEAVEPELVAVA